MAVPVSGRSKNRSAIHQGIGQLEQALKSGDLATAQSIATAIYEQDTAAPSIESSSSGIIIDPALGVETSGHLREKAACQIAECFYKHAELELAKQWAQTTTASGTLSNQYVRRAHVLLGDIAMAMDRDDEAVAWYRSVIELKNQYREQPAAYAGLLELLMLRKQDDLVEQWVRHGQNKFEGAGGLELDFLREASRVLKRRNHALWRELNEQIVELEPKKGKLQALRELASNARKFGRWAEAEQHYAAICALPLNSAEETVNAHLFLAEVQAKQSKDFAPALQQLQTKATAFTNAVDREYATYRLAKFYETQGQLDNASTLYASLCNGSSTSTWAAAALHQLAALKEKQGDLQTALKLYLEYPKRFPQKERLVLQAYLRGLDMAEVLGDAGTANRVVETLEALLGTAVSDDGVDLALAYYCLARGREGLGRRFLESGLTRAEQRLVVTPDPDARVLIHFRVVRRLADFAEYEQLLKYYERNREDLSRGSVATKRERVACETFRALALLRANRIEEAIDACQRVFADAQLDEQCGSVVAYYLYRLFESAENHQHASAFGKWVEENYPTGPWANAVRFSLARKAMAAGQHTEAKALLEKVVASGQDRSKMVWIATIAARAKQLLAECTRSLEER